ncbi:MAG TPA: hypothetical protein VKT73_16355 [Xanthobacteraceae bacterium]|nr:hypothetical protein [Xanthobacteraceae bacterium]
MLRTGVCAAFALLPRTKTITHPFDSGLRATTRGGGFIFASSSQSQATQEAAPPEAVRLSFQRGWYEMKTKKLIAATLATGMAMAALSAPASAAIVIPKGPVFGGATSAPWPIFACAGGIIVSALAANYRDHRELTAPEAWTCGVLFWFSQPKRKH